MATNRPLFNNKVESGTEIRITYDDDYLYFSGIFNIDPENITGPTYKRDALGWHIDQLAIVLDTFRDNENALWFWVSPSGSRGDAVISNDGQGDNFVSTFWDAIW